MSCKTLLFSHGEKYLHFLKAIHRRLLSVCDECA